MRLLILLPCFIFTFLAFSNPVSYGDFSYDIDTFTVVSGSSTFIDEFDDGEEPPSGPSGPETYFVNDTVSFSEDAETAGFLNLNSNDVVPDDVFDEYLFVLLLNNTNYINSGSGGSVSAKFRFPNGINTNTGFDISVISSDEAYLKVEKNSSGSTIASFYVETRPDDIDISEVDISDSMTGITEITLRLDVSTSDVVTASLDFGSDGTFDLTMSGSYTLSFAGGNYTGTFEAMGENSPTGFTASASGNTVTLNWDAMSGADGYNLYYGYSSGNYAGSVNLGNTASQVISNVPDGTYYLVITAYYGDGVEESPYSNEEIITVTSTTGLSAPTGFTASVSGDIVTLNWDAVSGADGYKLYYGYSTGNYAGSVDMGNVTGQVFNDVPEGTYYLVITAYANSEESGYSDEEIITVMSTMLPPVAAGDIAGM